MFKSYTEKIYSECKIFIHVTLTYSTFCKEFKLLFLAVNAYILMTEVMS